jgi:hypothetical protein
MNASPSRVSIKGENEKFEIRNSKPEAGENAKYQSSASRAKPFESDRVSSIEDGRSVSFLSVLISNF